ncbi:hypothetical protein F5X97DRAFT_147256 [Nemania serpens]|nr:hypothetical protein F5X97DRAFT_147256 [Nemania serpens]
MANEVPKIQILEKADYFRQTLLPLPAAIPYPPLAPSSVRLRSSVIGLTINNFTYAALGTLRSWWDVHPLPASAPAPYTDAAKYGRISAWGYAEVLESTVPYVAKGSFVWGYLPLGTLAQDLEVAPHPDPAVADRQFFVTNGYRQHVMALYNRYFVAPPSVSIASSIARKTPSAAVANDVVLRVMHATAFLMSEFVFGADASRVVTPGEDEGEAWGARDADLDDATVLVFAPGSKAAALFALILRSRPAGAGRPRRIVGASSEASRPFVEGTAAYDSVVLTSSADPVAALGLDGAALGRRLVVFDFGGRAGVAPRWAAALAQAQAHDDDDDADKFLFVGVGAAVIDPAAANAMTAAAAAGKQPPAPPYRSTRVNADDMRRRAMARVGEERYWADEDKSWDAFREEGIKGLDYTWGEGMEDVVDAWDRMARGEVLPSEGLVFRL